MVVALRLSLTQVALLGLLSTACATRVQDVESPYLHQLEALERRLGANSPQAPPSSTRFTPTGLYVEDDVVWVYSSAQPKQLGFRLDGSRGFVPAGTRLGPRETVRCVVGQAQFAGRTLCVGRSEAGGLNVVSGPSFPTVLEGRAGYRDVAQVGTDRLVVVDDLRQRLVTLGPDGAVVHTSSIPSGSYRVGSLGQGKSFVLSATRPHLSTYSANGTRIFASPRVAPLRNASFDIGSNLLLSVGPEDALVRRYNGPIQHLTHELRLSKVGGDGALELKQRLDLGKLGLTDPTSAAQNAGVTAVTLAGSDRVLLYRGQAEPEVQAVLGAPWSVVAYGSGFVGVSRLDDRLWYLPATNDEARHEVALSQSSKASPESLGERLFYGSALWQQNASSRAPYTCNSCHWETESDGRRHPGFLERRWEITRSLAGIGSVRPIFSTGGAKSLSRALEGLIRGLDERMWSEGATGYWDEPLTLETSVGPQTLSAFEVREALLTFLMKLPVRPGPLAYSGGEPWRVQRTRGGALFARDCASCHLPAASMRRPTELQDLSRWLERGGATRTPLSFGAAAFADTGGGARFTPNGNRISPLWGVGRRARLYVTGRARNLRQLVRELRPGSAAVHGGAGLTPYSNEEEQALWVFLNSL
ncbi:MAG: hypothetical protein KC492_32195 [Myxococcales bacterium]|nr:hypothetical protein [Myxococcales bacterium]